MYFDQQFIKSVISTAVLPSLQNSPENWSISLDSRNLKQGEIFIALKGARLDGHDFILDAIKNGASGVILNQKRKEILDSIPSDILKKLFIVIVEDTKEAIIKLASAWRAQFNYPIVGITGSVGKTSTKEILCNILKLNNISFIGTNQNQNTELGVSINILRLRSEHKAAVFEVGINKRGEMANIVKILRPTVAIITSIGHSHMEGLGSIDDIAAEKKDIFKFFKEDNIGIINGDQPILSNISYNHPIVKFGCKTTNQVQARKIQQNNVSTNFLLKLYKDKYKVSLDTNHTGRIMNSLAAASAAYLLNIPTDIIVKGLEMPLHINGRFEQMQAAKATIINDCYNASPESMKAALLAFEKVESKGQKIAVLGDMLELGVNSSFWHRQLGRFLRKVPSLNHVILVGDQVKSTLEVFKKGTVVTGATYEYASNWSDATELLKKRLDREAVILVKGSRGMQLNNLVSEVTSVNN